ncbi:hypothetical protein ACG02S_19670 [Roseateles sp. DC23W]|uniref:Fe-S oxidoreductase n=1 Tax=Pelomonas dachongensis TaxID=3299029 RepID=A0ABW7EV56_9BURK
MRLVVDAITGGLLAAALASTAVAQPAKPMPLPASAPVPDTAASRQVPTRNPAIRAAENAKEPGVQRPEERVIPQISLPLRSRNVTPATSASAPAGSIPGGVNDDAARCLAAGTAQEKAACERGSAASLPAKPKTNR